MPGVTEAPPRPAAAVDVEEEEDEEVMFVPGKVRNLIERFSQLSPACKEQQPARGKSPFRACRGVSPLPPLERGRSPFRHQPFSSPVADAPRSPFVQDRALLTRGRSPFLKERAGENGRGQSPATPPVNGCERGRAAERRGGGGRRDGSFTPKSPKSPGVLARWPHNHTNGSEPSLSPGACRPAPPGAADSGTADSGTADSGTADSGAADSVTASKHALHGTPSPPAQQTAADTPKAPSYLKLSCALGGYTHAYGSPQPPPPPKLTVLRRDSQEPAEGESNGAAHGDVVAPAAGEHGDVVAAQRPRSLTDTHVNGEPLPNGDIASHHQLTNIDIAAHSQLTNGEVGGLPNGQPAGVHQGHDQGALSNGSALDEPDFSIKLRQRGGEGKDADTPTPSKDGAYFLAAAATEAARLGAMVARAEDDLQTGALGEDTAGQLRTAIGKANLLTTKKFKQFRGLCHQNMHGPSEESPLPTTVQDLAGFWDMVLLQVHEISASFAHIDRLRMNGWRTPETRTPVAENKSVTPRSKSRPAKTVSAASKARSAKAEEARRLREEQRRALLAAKRQGRQRQQSASDQNAPVEIFVA